VENHDKMGVETFDDLFRLESGFLLDSTTGALRRREGGAGTSSRRGRTSGSEPHDCDGRDRDSCRDDAGYANAQLPRGRHDSFAG
jgi:hypothetical protein